MGKKNDDSGYKSQSGERQISEVCMDALKPALLLHGATPQSLNILADLGNPDLVNSVPTREARVALNNLAGARAKMGDDPKVPNACERQIDAQIKHHKAGLPKPK
jgi:hypothetical protein